MFVHASLNPIKATVLESVLYDMDSTKSAQIPCLIVGVSSYPGHAVTFQIVVEGDSLFSYIPPHLLQIRSPGGHHLWNLKDLVYHNCPSAEFSVTTLDYLKNKELQIFVKRTATWTKGEYLFTIDWYTGNDVLHCVVLENGQIGFFPQHKMLLTSRQLKPYKKLRREWIV